MEICRSLSCSKQLTICPDLDVVIVLKTLAICPGLDINIVFKTFRHLSWSWHCYVQDSSPFVPVLTPCKSNRQTSEELPNISHNVKFFFCKEFITDRSTHKLEEHLSSAVPHLLIHHIRIYPSYLEAFFALR
jgi:hypothetical protein